MHLLFFFPCFHLHVHPGLEPTSISGRVPPPPGHFRGTVHPPKCSKDTVRPPKGKWLNPKELGKLTLPFVISRNDDWLILLGRQICHTETGIKRMIKNGIHDHIWQEDARSAVHQQGCSSKLQWSQTNPIFIQSVTSVTCDRKCPPAQALSLLRLP